VTAVVELRSQALFLAGEWVDTAERLEVHSPWDDSLVGTVAVASSDQADAAVAAAVAASATPFPAHERSEVLRRTADLLAERADEVAALLTAESGKPVAAARAEVQRAVQTTRFGAEEARRWSGETVALDATAAGEGHLGFTIQEPIGVVAAITPFNFPLNLVAHKVVPALAAGCPVVLKPSERTPLTAGLFTEILAEAGLPAGWLNLVTGDPAVIVDAWKSDERVAAMTFTGSSRVGWGLKLASPRKHFTLELGSATAMYIAADADLDAAVDAATKAAFTFSGQVCLSLQRLYVDEAVHDEVVALLVESAGRLRLGAPTDAATDVGPLISVAATERVSSWIEQAVSAGATIAFGGKREGPVLQPTILTGVPSTARVVCEEVFGPVLSVVPVAGIDEAIDGVNSVDYGLNASVYTASVDSALRFAKRVQAGSCLVNESPSFRVDNMPYGGVKGSGEGREGVRYSMAAFSRQKLVILAG
jgi:acyl-CoA reductase-like NAD-dependent aldehyde dehydrogenase